MKPAIIVILVFNGLFFTKTFAQDLPRKKAYKLGFFVGKGVHTGYKPVNYSYQPLLFQWQFQKNWFRINQSNYYVDYVVQPQVNSTSFKESHARDYTNSWEVGVNLGILLRWQLSKRLDIYMLGSLGPHYISDSPSRQTAGFIFSDNFNVGASVQLYKNIAADIRFGLRHLSNANFMKPNDGLDNQLVYLGVKYVM